MLWCSLHHKTLPYATHREGKATAVTASQGGRTCVLRLCNEGTPVSLENLLDTFNTFAVFSPYISNYGKSFSWMHPKNQRRCIAGCIHRYAQILRYMLKLYGKDHEQETSGP